MKLSKERAGPDPTPVHQRSVWRKKPMSKKPKAFAADQKEVIDLDDEKDSPKKPIMEAMMKAGSSPGSEDPMPFVPWKPGQRYRTTRDGNLVKMECESDESDGHSSSQSARRGRKDESDSEDVLVSDLAKRESPHASCLAVPVVGLLLQDPLLDPRRPGARGRRLSVSGDMRGGSGRCWRQPRQRHCMAASRASCASYQPRVLPFNCMARASVRERLAVSVSMRSTCAPGLAQYIGFGRIS